jgi:hypothetical protein
LGNEREILFSGVLDIKFKGRDTSKKDVEIWKKARRETAIDGTDTRSKER